MANIPIKLKNAMEACDTTYSELVEVANGIIEKCTAKLDASISKIQNNAGNSTTEFIRSSMVELSLMAYSLSEIKEKSAMKAECAEIIRKEKYAKQFNASDGSVALRENQATVNISEEILVETIYNLVASVLKVKLDEVHRVVDTLKSALICRMAETKLASVSDGIQDF